MQDRVFGRGDQADFDTVATAVTWAGPGEHFTKRATEVTAQDLPELADVLPGHRNIARFHHIRYYAYRQVAHHAEFMTFADEVANFATGCRNQLPDVAGFPESEAAGIAKSVATWTWAVFTRGIEGQRNDENRMTAPARRPALGDAGYRGDPALNADSEVQRYRRSCRTRLDSIRVTGRVQLAAARFVTGWPVVRVATTIGVSQRQVQRYLAAADLPSKRRAKRILATERARARQPKEHDSAPGELTGRESTRTHNTNQQQEPAVSRPLQTKPQLTPSTKLFQKDAPGRSPPDYGLASPSGQDQARDGPEGPGGDG